MEKELHVCIVDDDIQLSETYADIIGDLFCVHVFNSAQQCLDAFEKMPLPDVVIADIRMPKMDGLEFVQQLRSRKFKKPVILVSGYAEKSHAIKAFEHGVFALLEKPFEPLEFRDLVNRAAATSLIMDTGEALLSTYQKLTGFTANLNQRYFEHSIAAENKLFGLCGSFETSPSEAVNVLRKSRTEAQLQKQLQETLSEIEKLTETRKSFLKKLSK